MDTKKRNYRAECLEVMNLPVGTPDSVILKNLQSLMAQWHPDRSSQRIFDKFVRIFKYLGVLLYDCNVCFILVELSAQFVIIEIDRGINRLFYKSDKNTWYR